MKGVQEEQGVKEKINDSPSILEGVAAGRGSNMQEGGGGLNRA